MQYLEDFLETNSSYEIPFKAWTVEAPKAQIVICHGMAEHSGRYEYLAHMLNEQGYSVWALDHRGHGEHCHDEDLGQLADGITWQNLCLDVNQLRAFAQKEEPVPQILFGHSMGSYVARGALLENDEQPAGLVLSGSADFPNLQLLGGHALAWFECLREGKHRTSDLIHYFGLGSFNRYFKHARTRFDWICTDAQVVDDFIVDPYCGFRCSNFFWKSFLSNLKYQQREENLTKIPTELPVLLVTGSQDPATFFATGTERLLNKLKTVGVENVEMKVYGGARHECFHEVGKEVVIEDLLNWLDRCLVGQ